MQGPALDRRNQLLARLHAKGHSGAEIARRLGLSRQRVSQLRKTLRLKPVTGPAQRQKTIPRLLREGLSGVAIARHFGVSPRVIYRDVRTLAVAHPALLSRLKANASAAIGRARSGRSGG
jgi:DNA-binding CsgD family transcriptional regulator